MHSKIKSQKQIVSLVNLLKKQGKKIVAFNGSFDILHSGHIESFEKAKKQGDILIILLNSDGSIKRYKGTNHPINSQNERAKILSAIQYIDFIVIFDEITPNAILSRIKPDVYCQGSEWGKNCIERKTVEDYGGKIYILKHSLSISTSQIIKKIATAYSKPDIKAIFLDRDGTINANKLGYTRRIEDFKFISGAISALRELSKSDYKIIIATNQSGISKRYYTKKDLEKLHNWMMSELKKQQVRLDKIYYCPHAPNDNCDCRKPKIGMFLKAGNDLGLNLSKSWFIGDDERDIIAGRNANIKTIKIGRKMQKDLKLKPHYYAKNLSEAVKIILSDQQGLGR